ncbi:hypothetical protein JDV02_010743 [Purpureocillium takamizusanense]|uniref:Ricin B lectin domain-containing protein n=1 Tax=Purpureocillium takamizusanense TaxID=2060973 RepID=A0A9Q8QUK3_9HYPO|nr:uncharacterized protein JDV02_010743 [Purpureocillium takamizusanense]UNI25034.1 hypothetical protein JDV02_010743 [Purpureocillium takamizusanense]
MSINVVPSTFQGAYWIRNRSNGSVLGVGALPDGATTPVGQAKLGVHQVLTDRSQMWLLEPLSDGVSFYVRNAQTDGVLDVRGSATSDGASVIMYPQTVNANQHWTFEWVEDADGAAYYRVNNNSSKKALTLTTGSGNAGVSSTWNNGLEQRWAFVPVHIPTLYRISHAQTGWFLGYDKNNGSALASEKVPITDASRYQLWFVESTDEGYVIRSVEDDNKVLDLSGSETADGTPVIAYNYHGKKNQQWKIVDLDASNPNDDRVKIVSAVTDTVIQVIEGGTSGKLQAQTNHDNSSQAWRLHQQPLPSVYWTTLQNLKTGKFLKQSESTVSPSSGMENALDYSVQWRFVPDGTRPHHFSVVNRATGRVLLATKESPIVVATSDRKDAGALWAVEAAGDGIAIVSTQTVGALDHYGGGDAIEAHPNNGITDPYHHWINVQVADRLPSFALINSRTGHCLAFKPDTKPGSVVMSTDSLMQWGSQWYLDIVLGEDDSAIYAIINKASGTVLDHWAGERIEAQDDDTSDPHHQWRLIPCPCGENYFQLQNVGTDRYLEERVDKVANATATTPMNPDSPEHNDQAQCWELVSARVGGFDLIDIDDDVLQRILMYLQPGDAKALKHRIVKRAPGKGKKGKNKNAHIPQNPRLLRNFPRTVGLIFQHLINDWVEDRLPTTVQAGRRVSTTPNEVQSRYNIDVPRSLLREGQGADRAGWMRIDIQGTYTTTPGHRVANIQGQWNTESLFHVIVPLGVHVGAETIRDAMRRSLETGDSVIIARENSTSPAGGSRPGTIPRPPPGPSGGSGNGWAYLGAAILAAASLL